MVTASSTSRLRNQLLVGSTGVVLAGLLALAVRGSIISQGNFVCDTGRNPNCGIVSGVRPSVIPLQAKDTGSGGLAKYDLILMASPFNSTASARGHKTGTGVIRNPTLHIISNPNGINIDCAVVANTLTLTGSTRYILPGLQNLSATGTIAELKAMSGVVLGPTEYIKCGSAGNPTASFSGSLTGLAEYSEVVN